MGVEKVFDINLKLTDEDLAKIDKTAAKAQKKLQSTGGIFSGHHRDRALPKAFLRKQGKKDEGAIGFSQSRPAQEGAKLDSGGKAPDDTRAKRSFDDAVLDALQKKGVLKGVLESDLGAGKARTAFSFLSSPGPALLNILKTVPFIAAPFAVIELAKQVIAFLVKSRILNTIMIDEIDNRNDALRDKQTEQEILSGFTQIIITTRSGETSPRNSYNSFNVFNENQVLLEDDFSIRDTSGNIN